MSKLNNCQFLQLPLLVWTFLNEATIDLVPLAAIEQFEGQATNRLLIAALEKYEDSNTTQMQDEDTSQNATVNAFCCK